MVPVPVDDARRDDVAPIQIRKEVPQDVEGQLVGSVVPAGSRPRPTDGFDRTA